MQHNFNVELAKKFGILEAILLQNIYFWIEKNKANEKHFYDGKWWTYNSKKAFSKMFPYATERQIKYSLEKLIKNDILTTGNYNNQCSNRTLWYSLTDKGLSIVQESQIDKTELSNDNGQNCPMATDKIVQSITDINTYTKEINNNKLLFTKKSFKKPTLDEVKSYCLERKNKIDPQGFIDYYDSVGWVVGKNKPMQDWKAAIRTWERERKKKTSSSNDGGVTYESI